MRTVGELESTLRRIDGQSYRAYGRIEGLWELPRFVLAIDRVQRDPFASPSRIRALIPPDAAGLPSWACTPGARAVGVACLLARRFSEEARALPRAPGNGNSGEIRMVHPGQQVLPSTAVTIRSSGEVEARFTVGLPARGRRVLGQSAAALLIGTLPGLIQATLLAPAHSSRQLRVHADTSEDAACLRQALAVRGLVAFVANGSILPRRSGVDDRPLEGPDVVPFESPPSLRVAMDTKHAGSVTGMGIPRGVTLIVGGGYHGKSTLLRALELGVYNHRPGDGRERVVTAPDAVKVRAEDGRSVASVDISLFIGDLPGRVATTSFSTGQASGSTSQAAAIAEALEAGASAILVDEDTAATNFLIRDRRMQALIPRKHEPIIPLVDRVRDLSRSHGVSSVLALGGSGDYLDIADTVIGMVDYRARDLTESAREVARIHPTGRRPEPPGPVSTPSVRRPAEVSLDPRSAGGRVSVRVRGGHRLMLGSHEIDSAAVEQIVSEAQLRTLGEAIVFLWRSLSGRPGRGAPIPELLDRVARAIDEGGLDALVSEPRGDLVAFRRHELAAVLNRIRGLRMETT